MIDIRTPPGTPRVIDIRTPPESPRYVYFVIRDIRRPDTVAAVLRLPYNANTVAIQHIVLSSHSTRRSAAACGKALMLLFEHERVPRSAAVKAYYDELTPFWEDVAEIKFPNSDDDTTVDVFVYVLDD